MHEHKFPTIRYIILTSTHIFYLHSLCPYFVCPTNYSDSAFENTVGLHYHNRVPVSTSCNHATTYSTCTWTLPQETTITCSYTYIVHLYACVHIHSYYNFIAHNSFWWGVGSIYVDLPWNPANTSPPPFLHASIRQNKIGEGAYVQDHDSSVWRSLLTDNCHMDTRSLYFYWPFDG